MIRDLISRLYVNLNERDEKITNFCCIVEKSVKYSGDLTFVEITGRSLLTYSFNAM